MLGFLGVSRSGYRAFLNRKVSPSRQRKDAVKKEIQKILDEQFNPKRPNAVWCTNITYIWTRDGFVYLNCVMDLFARKIISLTLSDSMKVSSVIETFNKAKAFRNTDLPLIIHSDCGSQYAFNA